MLKTNLFKKSEKESDEKSNKLIKKMHKNFDKSDEKSDKLIDKLDEKSNKLIKNSHKNFDKSDEKSDKLIDKSDEKSDKLIDKSDKLIDKSDEKSDNLIDKSDKKLYKLIDKSDKLINKSDENSNETEINTINNLINHLNISEKNHYTEIMKIKTLKKVFQYCIINKINSQQYGPLIENYILIKYNFNKNKASLCIGDYNKNNNNYEIKISICCKKYKKFNYVQIRPSHNCQFYILIAYYLSINNVNNGGELYIFNIPNDELKQIIFKYGNYAHGTKLKLGDITIEALNDLNNNKEYSIRPTINSNCWNELIKFQILENDF